MRKIIISLLAVGLLSLSTVATAAEDQIKAILPSAGPVVVYAENFEGAVGPEWSNTSTDTTPAGARTFLGRFGDKTVSLDLTTLPAHSDVTVSFDLFVIETWDGNGDFCCGPDIFDLSVAGGPTLLHTTFSNVGDITSQAYPDAYPGGANPSRAGAAENNTLGYYATGGDSVYALCFTFPHTGSALALDFSSLQAISDESWGLDNVKVETDGETDLECLAVEPEWSDTSVGIDIKPGGNPNSINCKNQKSMIPVAILSTADFDATTVDVTSVRFGKNGDEAGEAHQKKGQAKRHISDKNQDGIPDLVFHFLFEDTEFSCDDIPDGEKSVTLDATLAGEAAGEPILGVDSLRLMRP